jgi:hypothetical protein
MLLTRQLLIWRPKEVTPVSLAHIEIVSPLEERGLARRFHKFIQAPEEVQTFGDSPNIENGLIVAAQVYDDAGRPIHDAKVEVTTSDPTQSATLDYNDDGINYTFYYLFKNAGVNTITFTSNGMSKSVDVDVDPRM